MSPITTSRRDDDVLADVAAAADLRARHHVRKVPDLRAGADLAPLVDIGGLMREEFSHRAHRVRRLDHRMNRRRRRRNGRLPDAVRQLDRRTAVVDAEAAAGEHLLVDARVEIGEAVAELDLPPSTVIDRNVVLTPGSAANGRSATSVDRNQRTRARSSSRNPPIRRSSRRWTSQPVTGPNSHSSRSKKWMPMLVTMPPERSSEPFHDTSYQRPRT